MKTSPSKKKRTLFHNTQHDGKLLTKHDATDTERKQAHANIHKQIVSEHIHNAKLNTILNATPTDIHASEKTLPRKTRPTLAQLRTNKSPLLRSYLHKIKDTYISSLCPLCNNHEHNTKHLRYQRCKPTLTCCGVSEFRLERTILLLASDDCGWPFPCKRPAPLQPPHSIRVEGVEKTTRSALAHPGTVKDWQDQAQSF